MTYTSDNRNSSPPIPSGAPQGRTNVDLGEDTAALIAAVPAMLGFRPGEFHGLPGAQPARRRSGHSLGDPPHVVGGGAGGTG
ncbi:hypothetical protein [Corynebacterium variabile]